ncbi:unnamed protein product [Effrenium voratum]|nr:unnamed protein product [Effrenium voratum]
MRGRRKHGLSLSVCDFVEDPKHKSQLSRRRWYICVEVMRLICGANGLDCAALDQADATPLEWVLCLADERAASGPDNAHLQDKSIDELTRFIDGKKPKAKKKKKDEEERDSKGERPVFPEGTRWQLPLGWMESADVAAHLRCWRELGQCQLGSVIEGNRYLRLMLRPEGTRLVSTPASCVLAFPRHDAVKRMTDAEMLCATNVPFFSTLLNVFVFSNEELRDRDMENKVPPSEVSKGNLVFELLVRQRDCPTPPPLRFSSGPCSNRVDMSRTVQWTEPELVQLRVDGREEPVIRMRWWINVEVLQMVCKGNNIDCSGLESSDAPPFEWLCCVYDDGYPGSPALQECNWAFREPRIADASSASAGGSGGDPAIGGPAGSASAGVGYSASPGRRVEDEEGENPPKFPTGCFWPLCAVPGLRATDPTERQAKREAGI